MKEIDKLNFRPFTRFCMSIGAVPSSYIAGMTIEEQLLWFCSYLEKEVIPAVNNNAEAVEELQGLFTQLHDYVEHYFDNLDVQEEINNKLDDMADSGELEAIISSYLQTKAVFGFDTVADMKNAENLSDGCYAKTLGFYSKNDKGGATYKIRNITNDDVIDEMFIIELNDSANQLIAELITSDSMNIKQFGLYENDTDDDSDKLNSLLSKAKTNNIKLIGNNGICKITKSIDVPVYTYLDSVKLKFYIGSYINNYAIYVNANSSHNSWQVSYPYEFGCIKNCEFINNTNTDLNCIYNASNSEFNTIVFNGFDSSFKVPANYLDSYKALNLYAWNNRGSNYVFDFGFLGDSVVVNGLHAGGKVNIINIGNGHNGILLENIIANGNINIADSNVTINNLHQEGNNARVNIGTRSIVKLSNGFMYHNINADEHNFDISTNCHVILENCLIMYFLDNDTTDNSTDDNDVNIAVNSDIKFINCYKKMHSADIGSKDLAGIKTNLGMSINNTQYLNGSGFDNIPNLLGTDQINNTHNIYYNSASNIGKWNKETGTYYYAIIPLADITRKIKYSSSIVKVTAALTNGGNGHLFTGLRGFYRIYRGTTADTYSEYVDIPHFNNSIIDRGTTISGYKWIDRTPGDVDTFNSFFRLNYKGSNAEIISSSAPTVGTWEKSDIVYNSSTSATDPTGWICINRGTPRNMENIIINSSKTRGFFATVRPADLTIHTFVFHLQLIMRFVQCSRY